MRPGIGLSDGRRIHLNVDPVVLATIHNALPGMWYPGPGVLDRQGEALGLLDLSRLPVPPGGFGIPLWIVLIVLDPKSPSGIKYVPDTWVMRV